MPNPVLLFVLVCVLLGIFGGVVAYFMSRPRSLGKALNAFALIEALCALTVALKLLMTM